METFKKRQKEMRRLDRRREKVAPRMQRKNNRTGTADNLSQDDAPEALSNRQPRIEPTTDQPAT